MYEIGKMASYTRRRFKSSYMKMVDYRSIVYEALLKSIAKYKESNGHFANYFMTWLRSMVIREAINNPISIKLPEYLAKKAMQMSDDAKKLLITGKAKEDLMDIYKLTESQYNNLYHYYTEVPRHFSEAKESYVRDDDITIDIEKVYEALPKEYVRPIKMYFGLGSYRQHSPEEIQEETGMNIKDILTFLGNNEDIKEILEDYNV